MSLRLPPDFFALPVVLKVEQRFGAAGFARLIKLLEQFAASPSRASGVVEQAASDWRSALQVGPLELNVFLAYLETAGFLALEQAAEPGSPLRVTLAECAAFLPPLQLPGVANDWRQWFAAELCLSEVQGKDPYNQSLFRRWCATNVTIEEMNAAIELAVKAGTTLTPPNLHALLMTVRKEKLDVARR
ncbi:hypothetical protein GHO35_13520 [Pseudomonas helleri]|uniref:hypothetical protein n=1 Tax=Pseudomonas helleri TaxID=1608996 RepID=UPI0012963A0D|nr:hypothetical protein [Pseudomonas helleri]MQU22159.1 hypothetical protein [Pseudomonas helleri]